MTQTSSRLLRLLALLQTRRDWPGEELAQRLEVSCRTVRRDVERLRELGYPVDAVTGPNGGYRLHAGTAMPPLLLDDDEAVAIAVGLGGAASASVAGIEETAVRALVKLEQVLPSHLRRRVNALRSATTTVRATGPTVDAEALTTIASACRDREHLRFGYRSRDGSESRRRVEPHALVNRGQRWYLVAWDCGRSAWRTFRIDRIERVAPAGGGFARRELPAEDAAAYVAANLAGVSHGYRARVTLQVSAKEIGPRIPAGWGTVEAIDAHSCEYRASDDSLDWLAVRIGMLGVEFEIHEPPALAERFRVLADRFERASAAGGQRGGAPAKRAISPSTSAAIDSVGS